MGRASRGAPRLLQSASTGTDAFSAIGHASTAGDGVGGVAGVAGGVEGWEEEDFALSHGSKTSLQELLQTQTCVAARVGRRGRGVMRHASAAHGCLVTAERTAGAIVCVNLCLKLLNDSSAAEDGPVLLMVHGGTWAVSWCSLVAPRATCVTAASGARLCLAQTILGQAFSLPPEQILSSNRVEGCVRGAYYF